MLMIQEEEYQDRGDEMGKEGDALKLLSFCQKEFPDLDVTIRGAISIARRLQDPLAELVKIEPCSVGVGQYQHDVNQKILREGLHRTVVSCVNQVGVDLNTASVPLLQYVSGVQASTAQNIVKLRNELGGWGGTMLGEQGGQWSGAAADVFGQYAQQAGPAMAQTGWNMMMQPYQYAASLMGASLPENIVTQAPANPWSQILPNMASGFGMALPFLL